MKKLLFLFVILNSVLLGLPVKILAYFFALQVVSSAVRQLQHLVTDDAPSQCTSIYLAEARRGGAGGSVASSPIRHSLEQAYCKHVEKLLNDENCFKIFSVRVYCSLIIPYFIILYLEKLIK